jgi:hypothetical protein
MKTKPFHDHFHPRGEWVLFRAVQRKSSIALPNNVKNSAPDFEAIVVSHGPGEWQNGTFVPVENLPAGTLIVVPANHCKQPSRWAEHDLFVCPASSIICTMDALDDLDLSPVLVIPRGVLAS